MESVPLNQAVCAFNSSSVAADNSSFHSSNNHMTCHAQLYPFHSQVQKVHSTELPGEKCISEVVRIGVMIISHLSKL